MIYTSWRRKASWTLCSPAAVNRRHRIAKDRPPPDFNRNDISKAVLKVSDFEKMLQRELSEIIKKHGMFMDGRPGGARAVIRDRDLSGLSFVEARLSQSDFTGCILRNCDFTDAVFISATLFGCDMTGAKLHHTNLSRADLRGADIAQADLRGAILDGADLREGASIIRHQQRESGDGSSIYRDSGSSGHVILAGSDLSGASLQNAHATQADFGDANLSGADLSGAKLQNANLDGTDLTGSKMEKTDLRAASLKGAILIDAEIENADIKDADLTGALTDALAGHDFGEVELTLDEMLLRHTEWVASAGRNGKRLDLTDYDMRKIGSVSGLRLTAIKAVNTVFAGVVFAGAEVQSAVLDGSDFRKCDMRRIDLRASSLNGAVLNRADLRQARLNFLAFQKDGVEKHTPCRLEGAWLRYADLTGASLREAVLTGADLSFADLTDCDLRGADLRGADLTGVVWNNTQTSDAVFDPGIEIPQSL
ncbi:MAG: pentapeptide repeat-containing protein [Micavibrio sp.]|nr:MAG: pentapeptide repeat-containing protein [Micavibrio sp.]